MAASSGYPLYVGTLDDAPRRRARPLVVAGAIVVAFLALATAGNVVAYSLGPWQAPAFSPPE